MEQNTDNTGTESVETTQSEQKETKTFTQEQVDKIVQDRLSRERNKYSDYDTLKEKATRLNSLSEDINKLDFYKKSTETLNTALSEFEAQISEDKKSLIPEEFDAVQRLNYIIKNKSQLIGSTAKLDVKVPDKPDVKTKSNGLIEGKYATIVQFAQKDPKGYLEWEKRNNNNK